MRGVLLPGNSRVVFQEFPVPEPGYGQVLIRMKASSICGSDLRAIYREHLGHGPEAYQGVIAGHEPCGQIVKLGPGCKRFKAGDRVILYHISGCGVCNDCREGYMISCTSPLRAAYGWQRDGGHAEYLLAEENTCVALPDELSYVDGALVACGFGTVYEALNRVRVSGEDKVLITGMGPVGMAAGLIAKKMGATHVIGVDTVPARLDLSLRTGCADDVIVRTARRWKIKALTHGLGCQVSIDCSGAPAGRLLALQGTRRWGRARWWAKAIGGLRCEPDHHPQPDQHLWLLGNQPGPHGGPGGETGRVETEAGNHRHPSFLTGTGRRGVSGRGRRAVR